MTQLRVTRRQWLTTTAAACATLLAPRAAAHRLHVVLTKLTANADTKRWEFEHSIHYHDAALALFKWTGNASLTPASTAGRARLLLEIERSVQWWNAAGERLTPTSVGGAVNGDDIVLFQELTTPQGGGLYAVRSQLLQDVFADQSHTVSLELSQPYRVLRLDGRSPKLSFEVTA